MNKDRGITKAPKGSKYGKPKYNTYKTSDRRQANGMRMHQHLQNKTQISEDILNRLKTTKDEVSNSTTKKAITRHDPKTGKTWYDTTLTEWDPSHFRLFVGNISQDVTEELLIQTFIKYKSLSKVKVPMDEKKENNKGFAFLSFADPNDYLQCYKEMNGKYVGAKPITLERAKTEIGDVVKVKKR